MTESEGNWTMPHLALQLLLLLLLVFMIGCILGCLIRTIQGTKKSTPAMPAKVSVAEARAAPGKIIQVEPGPVTVPENRPESEKLAAPVREAAPAGKQVSSAPASKKAAEPVSTGKPLRPKGLPGARGGKPDKLQMISGVGPKLEKTLHGLGFFHFDQIAGWGRDQIAWVDEHLRYKGRIERDEWIAQCKLLAAEDMDQFNKLYGPGKTRSADRKPAKKAK